MERRPFRGRPHVVYLCHHEGAQTISHPPSRSLSLSLSSAELLPTAPLSLPLHASLATLSNKADRRRTAEAPSRFRVKMYGGLCARKLARGRGQRWSPRWRCCWSKPLSWWNFSSLDTGEEGKDNGREKRDRIGINKAYSEYQKSGFQKIISSRRWGKRPVDTNSNRKAEFPRSPRSIHSSRSAVITGPFSVGNDAWSPDPAFRGVFLRSQTRAGCLFVMRWDVALVVMTVPRMRMWQSRRGA